TIDGANKIADIQTDAESETATLRFAKGISAGEHVLEIAWKGGIRDSLRGLYRSLRGEERYVATQVEAADARRAFPCFDEPEFKARFSLELIHPARNAAIANMPIASQDEIDERRTRTRFRETPKISSYLVAFTVGPYEFTPTVTTPSGIPVRVCLPPGLAEQGIYARDAHLRSVEWLEDYTAIPYPYIKVDAIGIPDFEAGAMENPGAITYRTRLLAADSRNASITTMKGVFSTAAHELTHMWWGDLVTMRWWTDLWLNESFASFVGEKATATLNPEWRYWRALDESSGQDVTGIANAWIKEPGHPLVTIAARVKGDGLELEISQTRYFSDKDAKPTSQLWPVPLVVKYGTAAGTKETRVLL